MRALSLLTAQHLGLGRPFLPGPWPVPAPSCSLLRQTAQSPSVVTLPVRHRVFRRLIVQEENIKTPLGIGVLLAFAKPPAAFPLGQGNRILRDECGASGRRCPAAPLCADGGHSEGHLILCSGEGWEVWRTPRGAACSLGCLPRQVQQWGTSVPASPVSVPGLAVQTGCTTG